MGLLRLKNTGAVVAHLRKVALALRQFPKYVRRDAARRVARRWRARLRLQFADGLDPYGRPWKPPADGHTPPMDRSGRLKNSYQVVVRESDTGISVGFVSSRAYSWYLQKGTATVEARKQVPDGRLPDDWRQDLIDSYSEASDAWYAKMGRG